jgi:hypothetical protein
MKSESGLVATGGRSSTVDLTNSATFIRLPLVIESSTKQFFVVVTRYEFKNQPPYIGKYIVVESAVLVVVHRLSRIF